LSVLRVQMRAALRLQVLLALGLLAGCTKAPALHGRIDGLRDIVEQAARNGAYRCAPRELAQARAHLEFAETELEQGSPSRAEEHFRVAEPNARAAYRLSPAERCAPRKVKVAERPEPGDRDGDGYPDPKDECPDEPEDFDAVEDGDGCPEEQDSDGDGIPDRDDACPADKEDRDGYLDSDGCPEPDNDVDGLDDSADRCANEPEDVDGFQDGDGCPDRDNDTDGLTDAEDDCPNEGGPENNGGCPKEYKDVEVTQERIEIKQKIHFEFNKSKIRPVSYPILNTVAQVLRDHPDIRLEIQGHTDSRGPEDYNQKLSRERATAVRQYLLEQGIDGSRMEAKGYGESRPVESNRTAAGRAANRRVEFVRTDAEAGQQASE
jgi:outer membrane protein OmpA-like peptidoglycan-associated protein